MDKELNEDARTKQDLLYECSRLESKLSNEIIKSEHLEQQCKKQKEVKDKFMKNGVFSLEYDKETLRDMVLELQEKSQRQKEVINKAVLELVNIDGNLSNSQLSDRICNLIDILTEVSE